jgi:hypothetical protein
MIAVLLVAVGTTGAVYAGCQDCGHGHAACSYGYGFTQRACMSCQYGPSCSPTRPFNYRLAMDYPWTVPSYARAKALMHGALSPGCAAEDEPAGEGVQVIDESSNAVPQANHRGAESQPRTVRSSRRVTARATSAQD